MQIQSANSILTDKSPLFIGNTKTLTANRLLACFLQERGTLGDLLKDDTEVHSFVELSEILAANGVALNICNYIYDLPGIVCNSFMDFIAECPNIHITID